MSIFDPDALQSLYAHHGEKAAELANSLASIHSLTCKAMDNIEARLKVIHDLESSMQSFGIGLSIAREPATVEAMEEISRQDMDIQRMGSNSVAKCIMMLDLILLENGVDPSERFRLTGAAFALCIAPLPHRIKEHWTMFAQQVELRLATTTTHPISSVPTPRL